MVNVYDDISPEKAQAIMFLAGNGASASTPQPRVQTQVHVSRTPVGDVVYVNQPINAQPCSAISSSISVSSHPVGPTNKDEGAKKMCGSGFVNPVRKTDTPRVINSIEKVMQSEILRVSTLLGNASVLDQSGLEHASPLASGGMFSNGGANMNMNMNMNRWTSPSPIHSEPSPGQSWLGSQGSSSGLVVKRTIRVDIPVASYPNFNFVGRLLGPRGEVP